MQYTLHTELQYLKGVGPVMAERLARLGLHCVRDLFYFFPYRYEDRTNPLRIKDACQKLQETVLIKGAIVDVQLIQPRPKYYVVKAVIQDATGTLNAVWFNQKFMQRNLIVGKIILISGKIQFNTYERDHEIYVEDYAWLEDEGTIVPFYHLTEGVNQKQLRQIVRTGLAFLEQLDDPLPAHIRDHEQLMQLVPALGELHGPTTRARWKQAHRRIVFDEFLYCQLGMAMRYYATHVDLVGIRFTLAGPLISRYRHSLPYALTAAQERVIQEIYADLQKPTPMNRLLQGDVGSGKTEVALASLLVAVQSGYQVALMVPTEVLAEQHYTKLKMRLSALDVRVVSLLGKHTTKEKQQVYQGLAEHTVDVVIGTQAIIQDKVNFKKLGLVIIDEQHRFGVVQRQLLKAKSLENVDLLVMTATPIPRSLALTLYGDLDTSVIDTLPPGRTPIETYHVHPRDRAKTYYFCQRELDAGRQIYIIYPLIAESEKIDLKAAVESYEYLQTQVFKKEKVGLLHGKMKDTEKAAVMEAFRIGVIRVLVSTTVIEVGIDVPNATVMVIEHAERFGLAQLHQLRGRVGRGAHASYCFLVAELKSQDARTRIKAMVETTSGFVIAETDLQLRGPGEVVGTRQSGLPEYALADIVKDAPILQKARQVAFTIVGNDLQLAQPTHVLLRRELKKRSRGLIDYIVLD